MTLPAKHSGIGMGLLMMQNFIVGSIAIGIYSRVIDLETSRSWNPLSPHLSGSVFSNLYLVLAILCVTVFMIYYFRLRSIPKKSLHEFEG